MRRASDTGDALQSALQYFGLSEFRPGQREVIEAIMAGHDCLCIMPTGGGKSLCYQLPSMVRPGLTIVVSPLIALMKDQVDALRQRNIPATLINSSLTMAEQEQRLAATAAGKYRMIYVAPERLRNRRFLNAIMATPIQLLAVDEAHCISQWGHDFRPDYARIGEFRERLGRVQTVALTATATPRVREDIVQVLRLREPKQFMSGFARPNLHFGVAQVSNDTEKLDELGRFLADHDGSGIIYCSTRKRCETVVEFISESLHIPVGAYHAGLLPEQRRVIQDRFMNNDLRIVVATNAFGMGIDKPDLRFVIHFNMPGSLEAYYQEAGRAGRDGEHSVCMLFHAYQDRFIQEFFIDNRYPPRHLIQQVYEYLLQIDEDPIERTAEEIKEELNVKVSAEAIGSCLKILASTGVLERLDAGQGMARVCLDSDLPTLIDLLPREAKVQRAVLRALERAVGDRRGEEVFVRPEFLMQETGLDKSRLQRALRELNKLDAVDYVPPFRGRATHFRRRDVPFDQLQIDFNHLERMKRMEYDRLGQVISYAQSPLCRQKAILQYFGDASARNCGQCDRCQRRHGWPLLHDSRQLAAESGRNGTSAGDPSTNQGHSTGQAGTSSPSDRKDARDMRAAEQPGAVDLLLSVVDAIRQTHGRVGRGLIAQFLCGSQSAKVKKMGLARLAGFGMLKPLRQADATQLLDVLMHHGVLVQQEVTRNRPTLSVAKTFHDRQQCREMLEELVIPAQLAVRLKPLVGRTARASDQAARVTSGRSRPDPPSSVRPDGTTTQRASSNATSPDTESRQPKPDNTQDIDAHATSPTRFEDSKGAGRDAPRINHHDDNARSSRTGEQTAELGAAGSVDGDYVWTLMLFRQGADWHQVRAIRRMDDEELAASLYEALEAGKTVEPRWILRNDTSEPTAGQLRILRALRRRRSAGLS